MMNSTLKMMVAIMALAVITVGIGLGYLCYNNVKPLLDNNARGTVRAMQCLVSDSDGELAVLKDETNMLWSVVDVQVCEGEQYIAWIDDMNTPKDLTDDVVIDYVEVDTK